MSFTRPTLSDLIERGRGDFETRLPGADSRLRHSALDVLVRTHAGAAAGLYGYLDVLARQILPDTAEAEYLARHAAIWGIRRKGAIPAQASASASGVNGSVIPAGAELQRADGAFYTVLADSTVALGVAAIAIEAVTAGAAGDVEAGSVLTFTSPVAGVAAEVSVTAPTMPGSDEEDDASLLARLLDRIRKPPLGGSANDYVQWALAQPGVTRAWSYEAWMGLGTVGLTFVMDGREDVLPLAGDVAAVQAALDLLRPVTAELVVFAPSAMPVDVTLRINPDTPAVRAGIALELADLFAREAEPGGTIHRSRISEAVSQASGEFSHELVLPAADLSVGPGELPVFGEALFL